MSPATHCRLVAEHRDFLHDKFAGSPGFHGQVWKGQGRKGDKKCKRELRGNDVHTRSTNFMRHVGQELGFRPISKFGSFSSSGISLNRISQVEDHLVDLPL